MDLFRSMQAFVTVAQLGSMSAAAPSLGLSAAMVGQHIAALEERLGTRLLNRTTRRQSLTDFGLSYFEQCRDILERVAVADEQAEILQHQPRGQLRITAPMTFGAEVLMPALGGYRDQAPDVTLDIVLTDRNVDLVDEGFDAAFRIGTPPDGRLIARRLVPYRMMICASPDYLARAGTPRHPIELSSHESIIFTPAARSPWRLSNGDDRVEVTPARSITVNSGQAVRMAAGAGLGLVMQPAMLLMPDVQTGRLVQLFPDWHLGERPMSLLYYRDRRMTPRLRSFIAFSIKEFADSRRDDAAESE
jgi:DNA-binding transcriptional LysR family regulator